MIDRIVVEYVGPELLRPAGFNPENRVLLKTLQPLLSSIRKFGFCIPILTGQNYEVIDGHRRLAAALYLKLPQVPIIRVPISLQVGWSDFNSATMKIDAKTWVQVLAKKDFSTGQYDYDYRNASAEVQRAYRRIIALLPDGIDLLAANDMSFGVLDSLSLVKRTCKIHNSDTETQAVALRWLIVHRMQYQVRKAVESGISATELLRAIRADVPLRTAYVAAIRE